MDFVVVEKESKPDIGIRFVLGKVLPVQLWIHAGLKAKTSLFAINGGRCR